MGSVRVSVCVCARARYIYAGGEGGECLRVRVVCDVCMCSVRVCIVCVCMHICMYVYMA